MMDSIPLLITNVRERTYEFVVCSVVCNSILNWGSVFAEVRVIE